MDCTTLPHATRPYRADLEVRTPKVIKTAAFCEGSAVDGEYESPRLAIWWYSSNGMLMRVGDGGR